MLDQSTIYKESRSQQIKQNSKKCEQSQQNSRKDTKSVLKLKQLNMTSQDTQKQFESFMELMQSQKVDWNHFQQLQREQLLDICHHIVQMSRLLYEKYKDIKDELNEFQKLAKQNEQIRGQIQYLKQQNKQLQDIKQLSMEQEQALRKYHEEYSISREQISALEAYSRELDSSKQQHINIFEEKMENQSGELQRLKVEIQSLLVQLDKANQQILNQKLNCKQLSARIQELQDQSFQLNAILNKLQAQCEESKCRIKELQQTIFARPEHSLKGHSVKDQSEAILQCSHEDDHQLLKNVQMEYQKFNKISQEIVFIGSASNGNIFDLVSKDQDFKKQKQLKRRNTIQIQIQPKFKKNPSKKQPVLPKNLSITGKKAKAKILQSAGGFKSTGNSPLKLNIQTEIKNKPKSIKNSNKIQQRSHNKSVKIKQPSSNQQRQLKILRQKNQQYKKHIVDLSYKLDELKEKVLIKSDQITQLQGQTEILKDTQIQLEQCKDNLEKYIKKQKKLIQQLQKVKNFQKQQKIKFQEQKQNYQLQFSEMYTICSNFKEQLKNSEQQKQKLQNICLLLKDKIKQYEQTFKNSLQTALNKLYEQQEEQCHKYESSDKLASKRSSLQNSLRILNSERNMLTDRTKKSRDQILQRSHIAQNEDHEQIRKKSVSAEKLHQGLLQIKKQFQMRQIEHHYHSPQDVQYFSNCENQNNSNSQEENKTPKTRKQSHDQPIKKSPYRTDEFPDLNLNFQNMENYHQIAVNYGQNLQDENNESFLNAFQLQQKQLSRYNRLQIVNQVVQFHKIVIGSNFIVRIQQLDLNSNIIAQTIYPTQSLVIKNKQNQKQSAKQKQQIQQKQIQNKINTEQQKIQFRSRESTIGTYKKCQQNQVQTQTESTENTIHPQQHKKQHQQIQIQTQTLSIMHTEVQCQQLLPLSKQEKIQQSQFAIQVEFQFQQKQIQTNQLQQLRVKQIKQSHTQTKTFNLAKSQLQYMQITKAKQSLQKREIGIQIQQFQQNVQQQIQHKNKIQKVLQQMFFPITLNKEKNDIHQQKENQMQNKKQNQQLQILQNKIELTPQNKKQFSDSRQEVQQLVTISPLQSFNNQFYQQKLNSEGNSKKLKEQLQNNIIEGSIKSQAELKESKLIQQQKPLRIEMKLHHNSLGTSTQISPRSRIQIEKDILLANAKNQKKVLTTQSCKVSQKVTPINETKIINQQTNQKQYTIQQYIYKFARRKVNLKVQAQQIEFSNFIANYKWELNEKKIYQLQATRYQQGEKKIQKIILWRKGLIAIQNQQNVAYKVVKGVGKNVADKNLQILGNSEIIIQNNTLIARSTSRNYFIGNLGNQEWKINKISIYNS